VNGTDNLFGSDKEDPRETMLLHKGSGECGGILPEFFILCVETVVVQVAIGTVAFAHRFGGDMAHVVAFPSLVADSRSLMEKPRFGIPPPLSLLTTMRVKIYQVGLCSDVSGRLRRSSCSSAPTLGTVMRSHSVRCTFKSVSSRSSAARIFARSKRDTGGPKPWLCLLQKLNL